MDDKMPKRSYGLIAMLDEAVATPKWPRTGTEIFALSENSIRTLCHAAGARELVDQLVAQVEEEILDAEDIDVGVLDGPDDGHPRVFGPDGNIRKFLSSLRLAGGDAKFSVDIGDRIG